MSSSLSGLLSYQSLVHALSGACGSAIAMSTFFPLDTVRTRLQLQQSGAADGEMGTEAERQGVVSLLKHILRREGLTGLYRGLGPVLQSLFCSNFVYFYSFHGLKRAINPNKTALNDLLCGMTAGIINVMATTPLWVVNTRLKMQGTAMQQRQQTQHYRGMMDGLARVYADEGVAGLWASCGSSLILVINPAIQFMAYEAIKRWLLVQSGGQAPSSAVVFLVGAAAKAVATVLTYPIQLAQARQRHGSGGGKSPPGLVQVLRAVLREGGPTGLFRGLNAKLLQTVLTAALMFLCYEKISATVFALMMGQKRSVAVAAH